MLCGSALQERPDFLTMNCTGGLPNTVGVSTATGGVFDISFASGSIRVDAARNAEAYGAEVKPAHILNGTIDPPPEMQASVCIRGVGRSCGDAARYVARGFGGGGRSAGGAGELPPACNRGLNPLPALLRAPLAAAAVHGAVADCAPGR